MKYKFILFAIVLQLLVIKCTSSTTEISTVKEISESIYKDNIRINVKEVYSWINFMPGAKPKFNITGSLELLDASDYELKNVKIKKIYIIQNKNTIYQITPKVEDSFNNNRKLFLFSTIRGLNYTSILQKEKPIEVEIEFSDSATEFKYLIKDVKIEEAH